LETKGLAARTRSQTRQYSVSGIPYQNNWSVDRAVKEGFQTNPWIFRAVEVITYAGLIRKIVLRADDPDTGEVVPLSQDPTRLLFCLNRRTNPWETAKMFRYRLIAQFLLSSKGVYIEVARSRAGRYAMLTLLDPDLVDIVPSTTNPISAFQVRTTGDTGGKIDTLPPFDPEDTNQPNSVLWVRSPHPTLLPAAMSPMEAAGLSVDLDRYARLYNRDYMQSNGRPGGILAVKGTATEETLRTLEARFNHRAQPGEVTAIQADAMDYKDLSSTPRDLQWGDVMDRMRKEASMVFGVPESMMGDASARTFANADAEYAVFMEHRFAPLLALLDDQLDVLTGGYADDLWLRHDLTDVWVLARHRRAEEDRAAADQAAGLLTVDDVREVKGLPRLNVPASRVLWLPPGRLAVADGEHADDADDAAGAPQGGMATPADPATEAAAGAERGAAIGAYNAQTNAAAARLRVVGGTNGAPSALEQRHGRPAELTTADPPLKEPELEGKQRGAREPGDRWRTGPPAPIWR